MKQLTTFLFICAAVFSSTFAKAGTINFKAASVPPGLFFSGSTTLNACSGVASPINANLTITDAATSGSETWTITTAPTSGTLGGFSTSAVNGTYISTANGGIVTPTGLTYTSTSQFTGTDNFTVTITNADGIHQHKQSQ